MSMVWNIFVIPLKQVFISFCHNWPYLLASIVISAFLKLYIDTDKVAAFLRRNEKSGILAATGLAVTTPLCSCGTTAVVLGMMASAMPWAPIVAFMVASPLTSPEGVFYTAGLFGWPFAIAFFLASIVLGLAGGAIAALFERWGLLANQARFATAEASGSTCGCKEPGPEAFASIPIMRTDAAQCGCGDEAVLQTRDNANPIGANTRKRVGLLDLIHECYSSAKQLLPMFLGFAYIGYLLNGLIPARWVSAVLGSGNVYSVPIAATVGLPLYINSEGSLPLVRALLDNGMSQGAALAFLIAGAGTSIGAIAGALTIARWRVVGLVVGVLWVGAIISGYSFDLWLGLKAL